MGSFATYGYRKDPTNHSKLIVDELAAETVQDIFRWKISGMNNQSIADRLNAKKVPSPAARKLQSGAKLSLHLEEHKNLKKLIQKNSEKSNLETKKVALNRKIEQLSGNIVRLESQKRSGYEQYVLGKISKEKFLELKQDLENEIVELKREKATKEKKLAVVQEELRQKKQIADNTEVLLTADNLQQYVKKIEVDREKITCMEFAF